MDGAQARLKLRSLEALRPRRICGKGGWGSGEIETLTELDRVETKAKVERVDGAQARLKLENEAEGPIERGCGKGGWGSGEIETLDSAQQEKAIFLWKGWMGLRRD